MEKAKPFCVAPFINFYYKGSTIRDRASTCCESRMDFDKTKKPFEEWWTSDLFQEIRTSMLNGAPHNACLRCISVEESGGYNAREFYQKILDNWIDTTQEEIEFDIINGNQFFAPISLDYRGSNLCNLKCRMCHPSSSSEIAKEIVNNKEIYEEFEYSANKNQLFDRDDYNNFIESVPLEHIQRFKILGGEPLIQPDVYKALNRLIESNNKNVTIVITTNGTTIPKRFIDYITRFEKFNLRISLDGISHTNEYIRTNAHWSKIKSNCEKFAELSMKYSHLYVGFSFVIQAYNAFQLSEIAEFCIDWQKKYPNCREPFFAPVEQDWLSTQVLNDEDITLILNELKLVDSRYPNNKIVPSIINIISKFDPGRSFDRLASRDKWIKYTRLQDHLRKTDILKVDNRFKKYYE